MIELAGGSDRPECVSYLCPKYHTCVQSITLASTSFCTVKVEACRSLGPEPFTKGGDAENAKDSLPYQVRPLLEGDASRPPCRLCLMESTFEYWICLGSALDPPWIHLGWSLGWPLKDVFFSNFL